MSDTQVKVSAIVPISGVDDHLEERLASIESQSLLDIEIICACNDPSDDALEIMRRHASSDHRIVLIDEEGMSYGAAINAGIKAASGEYIAIVEANDFVLPRALEDYYTAAKDNGAPDVVKSDFRRFIDSRDDRTFELCALSVFPAVYDRIVSPSEDTRLFHLNNDAHSGIYNRAFLDENGIWCNEAPGTSTQNDGFWFQVFSQAKTALFLKSANYLVHNSDADSSIESKSEAHRTCEEYDFIRSVLLDKGLQDKLGMCAKKRYVRYEEICNKIDDRLLFGFFAKFSADFRKLMDASEVDRRYFSPKEWSHLMSIVDQGSSYYTNCWLPQRHLESSIKELRREKDAIEHSRDALLDSCSFRIGRALLKPIGSIRRLAKRHESAPSDDQKKGVGKHECDYYVFNASIPTQDIQEHILREYADRFGGNLDLDDIRSYNEKIQSLKIDDPHRAEKAFLSDKYAVREWVKDRIGEEHLVPLLGVWDDFEEIDFDELPPSFVLKGTHGCKMSIIVRDKDELDRSWAKEQFDDWMQTDYAFFGGFEMHYSQIKPKIIAEDYIENDDDDLYDYKFLCFDGKVHYIQYISNRSGGSEMLQSFFDREWNLQPFGKSGRSYHSEMVPKPDNLDEMIEVAEKLSAGFEHVRVDLYNLQDGGIRFGEMTFTSAGGYCPWEPPETDFMLGDLWKADQSRP